MLLVGDIGGTKTNLAIYPSEPPLGEPVAEKTFQSAHYQNLESLVREFLSKVDLEVDRAAFGIAGPVVSGRVTTTNLPWEVDGEHLQKVLNLRSVQLLNDLEAIAEAIPHLKRRDLHILNQGRAVPGGSIALIAPGTGLGEAFLTWDERRSSRGMGRATELTLRKAAMSASHRPTVWKPSCYTIYGIGTNLTM